MKRAVRLGDLRGYSRLAIDATLGLTDLVEGVHRSVLGIPRLGSAAGRAPLRTRGLTGFVYRSVRKIAGWVGRGVDGSLARLEGVLASESGRQSAPEREALLAALNGVLGDYLAATASPLAIPMELRPRGPRIGGRVVVLVHGLCMNDLQWQRKGHDHGAELAADLGWTPVYLRYNTGRSLEANGREFARHLDELVRTWPEPVTDLAVLAHSMGGLVTRIACREAEAAGLSWRSSLRKIIFVGTPHHGAPLERGGHWLTNALGWTSYTSAFARLGRIRSAGITDLRHGLAFLPLPDDVAAYAAAAVLAKQPRIASRKKGRLLGDGLVPLDSALGDHVDPAKSLGIPSDRRWVGHGMGHLQLLDRGEIFERIRGWLAEPG